MNPDGFERFLRGLNDATPRRGVMRLLAGLGGMGLFGHFEVEAKRKKKKRKKNDQKKWKKEEETFSPPAPPASPPPPPAPPPPPICVGSCTGKRCGDDGCGGTCGPCSGGSVCEGGQCVAACCLAGTSCVDGYCTCSTSGSDFCSCPAGDVICHGASCCLAEDTCIAPVDCFDGDTCACSTQTCGAVNDVCRQEFAFCGSGAPGSCGCFTRADGSPFCATMPVGHYSPEFNECSGDDECGDGEVCANVGCCNPGVLPFVGRCVTPCATG